MTGRIALKEFVARLILEMMPIAISRRIVIINNISIDIVIETDEEKFLQVLEKLMMGTIRSSQNSCIRISAEVDDDRTFITIKDNNSNYSGYISGKMNKVESIVNAIGGKIYFEFNNRHSITIMLCLYQPVNTALKFAG